MTQTFFKKAVSNEAVYAIALSLLIDRRFGIWNFAETVEEKDLIKNTVSLIKKKIDGETIDVDSWKEMVSESFKCIDSAISDCVTDILVALGPPEISLLELEDATQKVIEIATVVNRKKIEESFARMIQIKIEEIG